MEVTQVHMNGSIREASYANNSLLQVYGIYIYIYILVLLEVTHEGVF